jgi:glycosyltransferase involved in cell wall biosynthesis
VLAPSDVSCVIPTRGNVDLTEVLESLPFTDVVVYDNSQRDDQGIYARYAAMIEAKNDIIVTQDDDVVVPCWAEILAAYEPGVLTVNYAEPWDIPWVACGAVFDYELPFEAFTRYLHVYPGDRLFTHRICDAVFGLLTDRVKVIDYGHRDLPYGLVTGRVSTSDDWYQGDRLEGKRRCAALKVAA